MTTIKIANTTKGFAIALLSGTSRTGKTYYEVVRVNESNQYVTIHRLSDLAAARKLANQEWAADRRAA